jgi:hypothetical protein
MTTGGLTAEIAEQGILFEPLIYGKSTLMFNHEDTGGSWII